MMHSRFLPIAAGALVAALPTLSHLLTPSSEPAVAPEAARAAATPTVHPHHPMVTALAGVRGNVKLSWFTVPFNPEQVKKAGPNYIWYRGFQLTSEVAMKSGDVTVPAGDYGFGFQLDNTGKEWSVLLIPTKLMQLQRQLRGAQRRGRDTTELKAQMEKMTKAGIKNLKLPSATFKAGEAEHMAVQGINHGYKQSGRGRKAKPLSGIAGEFRVSFGNLHTSFKFDEVLKSGQESHGNENEGEHKGGERKGEHQEKAKRERR